MDNIIFKVKKMNDYYGKTKFFFECIQCGVEFSLADEDLQWFASKGFDLPRRCQACRKRKIKSVEDYSNRKYEGRRSRKHFHRRHEFGKYPYNDSERL
jgi:hypothetical protein